MDDIRTFLFSKALERMEIGVVVFHKYLVYEQFLHIARFLLLHKDKEDKRFEEVLLLAKVILILLTGNFKGIHGDRTLLGVGNIRAMIIAAYTFVGVTCINQHNVGVLNEQLAYHTVHVERLT